MGTWESMSGGSRVRYGTISGEAGVGRGPESPLMDHGGGEKNASVGSECPVGRQPCQVLKTLKELMFSRKPQ